MRHRIKESSVKGTSRRVVIIPCEKDSVFEQILCIVRDEQFAQIGVTAETILQEAQSLISEQENDDSTYFSRHNSRRLRRIITLIILLPLIVVFFYLMLKT